MTMMKAIRAHRGCGASALTYAEVPIPAPGAGEALVRVHAAGVTPTELSWPGIWKTPDGSERTTLIPGHELSGVVAAVGPGVTEVAPGEAVYALIDFQRDGCDAEYVVVRAADLAPKPGSVDHLHAAATPLSALTAWQALFEHGGLEARQRVLIHGAAGGVGSFAVQFARWRGAQVIGTASTPHLDFVRELGADQVIDYTATRFEEAARNVDLVFDPVGGDTQARSWQSLGPGGRLVSIVSPPSDSRGMFFVVKPNRDHLEEIARLIDAGVVRPVVAGVFPIARAREAFERGLAGQIRGKLVLQVAD